MALDSVDPQLIDKLPKEFANFAVVVETHKRQIVDITRHVTEISLYESIHSPFLYGEIILIDNSSMLSTFPFIGQERVRIQWSRDSKKMTRDFCITDVFDVKPIVDGGGGYGISITSEKQLKNATSLFSKYYEGLPENIIKNIHTEYLDEDIEIGPNTRGKEEHSVVFPFIKPYQAINMIRKNVLAEDMTPLFFYDRLYEELPVLQSFKSMYDQEPIIDLYPSNTVNKDRDAQGSRSAFDSRGQIIEYTLPTGYDTLEKLSDGSFASYSIVVDASKKKALRSEFDYYAHAPAIANEYITPNFTIGENTANNLYDTQNYVIPQNTHAFESTLPNLNGTDELDKLILNSYRKRMKGTSNILIYMDSIHIARGTKEIFSVGKTVNFTFPRFSPKLEEHEDIRDRVNSGKYIISSIRHYIKNNEYTMSVELMRDGIGEDAQLNDSGLNSPVEGDRPVYRQSIYGTS